MTVTDAFLFITLSLLIMTGVYQGSLRSLIGPACCLIAMMLAGAWYMIRRDLLITVIIIIAGPLILGWLTHLVLEMRSKEMPPKNLSITDRLGGAAILACWGTILSLAFIAMAIVLPLSKFHLGDITDDVLVSRTYSLLRNPLTHIGIIPPSEIEECLNDVCSMAKGSGKGVMNDSNIQALVNSPEFQQLLADPAITAAMQKQDLQALLSNPAIIKLRKNPAFIAKILRAYPGIRAKTSP